jgi:quercetin dioxygenase-like cupin family protein
MSEQYYFAQNLTELVMEIPPDSIVSRTFFEDDQFKAILFGFAPGQELSEHTSARPAVLHFVEGEASLTVGDDSFTIQQNAWVQMQPKLPHSIVAITKVVMLLYLL